ncbi:hypothetical protein TSUD_370380 [Trifolium subterraneum]|uniref:Uncharacterized protein n=1 Tax=Trifolium subterraneum TaxID=3900 RepID=A0A2Z6NRK5_TRISU|nr:hypothetical protein TSUD_370380 [Trifolium subterraneum]
MEVYFDAVNPDTEVFKLGTNGSKDPLFKTVELNLNRIILGLDPEMEFSNVAGSTEGEHRVHVIFKPFETFLICNVMGEGEDPEMLPEVAPPARHEVHSRDGGNSWEEGHYMAQ